ncbi:MAG: RNA pseudouridine synthase [Marinovum sp.]|jgi:tRNA pseudouridine32 synthase/23S rRNA pseudouridine746 synthase|nr:RNA pseudouridine synthase [Marinovum sp.]|tara:strand:- start:3261 stop:3896 length:636 start_codon:yes stop_codon:yes gene_type:complete
MEYNPPTDPLDILHEDSHILVVNKPAGLLSVPGKGIELADCLLNRLKVAFPNTLLVHRLDRDTSGVMIFAQTEYAQRSLSMQFEKRQVKKVYVARVFGVVTQRIGLINLPLIVDWENRPRQMVCHETGKVAVTEWYKLSSNENESRLRLVPKTGRSHQLRVHCMALGHPILGDPIYGKASSHCRMMLHSEELRVNHPESGFGSRFRSKAPF